MPEKTPQSKPADTSNSIIAQVAERIRNSDNVLVALSKNPSVDELSAAIGLTFVLDKLGKHATAIFSGAVPNAIEFLEPEKTFESNTNSLQDFIIALDKEKADHLRYKIDGDYVKVFITPYRTTIDENDLEFSHGDYNIDLIIAINVDAESDLDSALSEYGKIKHDASSINISAEAPGKFGDLEWGDPSASSVSEMIVSLADVLDDGDGKEPLVDKPTATALLAGIVAATNRFSNDHTSAETMSIASELMTDGADQQLISSSIPVDILTRNTVDMSGEIDNQAESTPAPAAQSDPTRLEINRNEESQPEATEQPMVPIIPDVNEEELSAKKPDNVPDLPTPEPSPIAPADETPTAPTDAPEIETTAVPAPAEAEPIDLPTPELEPLAEPQPISKPIDTEPEPAPDSATINNDKTLVPPSEEQTPLSGPIDYASEMARELEAASAPAAAPAEFPTAELPAMEAPLSPDMVTTAPANAIPVAPQDIKNDVVAEPISTPPTAAFQPQPNADPAQPPIPPTGVDPATAEYVAPPLPMPNDGSVLPPPPVPFDMGDTLAQAPAEPAPVAAAAAPAEQSAPIEPIMPAVLQEENTVAASPSVNGVNPVMQDQVYNDPSAFHIPGM